VQPEQVDVVGAESPEARLERLHHVLAVIAAGVWVVAAGRERVLGRDHEVLAVGGDEVADELLARPVGVVVRRVDEVPAGCREGVKDLATLVL
jgi:hypothetical protein